MLITRPRMSFGAFNCTSDDSVAKTITMQAPAPNSTIAFSQNTRNSANITMRSPNTSWTVSSARPM